MFASLHRADGELPPEDGVPRFVLTDHRTAKEMKASRDLSIIFAMVRVLRTRRLTDDPPPIVYYMTQYLPPDFLVEAVGACGGRLVLGKDPKAWRDLTERGPENPARSVEVLANESMAAIAERAASENRISLDRDGLERYEQTYFPDEEEEEEDEDEEPSDGGEARWTGIVKLAAFAGELLRRETGGSWIVQREGDASFPLLFSCKAGRKEIVPNLLGKAQKLCKNGQEDSLLHLVSTVVVLLQQP